MALLRRLPKMHIDSMQETWQWQLFVYLYCMSPECAVQTQCKPTDNMRVTGWGQAAFCLWVSKVIVLESQTMEFTVQNFSPYLQISPWTSVPFHPSPSCLDRRVAAWHAVLKRVREKQGCSTDAVEHQSLQGNSLIQPCTLASLLWVWHIPIY